MSSKTTIKTYFVIIAFFVLAVLYVFYKNFNNNEVDLYEKHKILQNNLNNKYLDDLQVRLYVDLGG